jgi:hypothetical protein
MSEPRYSVETLVEALYRGILSRAPDEKGFFGKIQGLMSLGSTATELTAFVRGFLLSQEYQEKATRQFAQRLIPPPTTLNNEPVDIVSLGSHCLVAHALKKMGLKRYSCTFDWIFSRPSMVEHCIKDSFAMLTDRSQYQSVTNESGTELRGLCHHAFYRNSFDIDRVFNHRDMRREDNYQYILRCIHRFTRLLESANRKIFVLLSRESSWVSNKQFLSLHNTLAASTSNWSSCRRIETETRYASLRNRLHKKHRPVVSGRHAGSLESGPSHVRGSD